MRVGHIICVCFVLFTAVSGDACSYKWLKAGLEARSAILYEATTGNNNKLERAVLQAACAASCIRDSRAGLATVRFQRTPKP